MIWRKYNEGRIVLTPFASLRDGGFEATQEMIWDVIYYAPLGWLLAHLESAGWRRWSRLPAVVGIAALAAFGMELLQVFVWSRQSDVTDALVGMLAAVAGWVLTTAYCRWLPAKPAAALAGRPRFALLGMPALVLLAWLVAVFLVSWQPFDFSTDPHFISDRQAKLTWLPFADYMEQSDFNAFEQALHKTMLFVPLGAILAATCWMVDIRYVSAVAFLLAFMIASAVEVGQLYLPSHTASVTDVLLEMAGALLGCGLGVRLRAALTRPVLPAWRTDGIHG
jgi:VanZ family protein